MNEQTDTEDLADFLHAIVEHLRLHPHLPKVHIYAGQGDRNLQVGASFHEAQDLHEWFTSLEDSHAEARPATVIHYMDAYVAVTGRTKTGVELRVWDVVPGLGKVLGYTQQTPRECEPLDEAVLVDFALTSETAA